MCVEPEGQTIVEIEVTPEMIEAGVASVRRRIHGDSALEYGRGSYDDASLVMEVYTSMRLASVGEIEVTPERVW